METNYNISSIMAELASLRVQLDGLLSEFNTRTYGDFSSPILPPLVNADGGGQAGSWSGWWWFAGERRSFTSTPELWADNFNARFLKIDLKTGEASPSDDVGDDDIPDQQLDLYEWYQVMTREKNKNGYVYTPSSHTVGDIRCRIT